jgi:cytochrome oxidase Cu insertion factor (SCO1/SenC/PrrC family)
VAVMMAFLTAAAVVIVVIAISSRSSPLDQSANAPEVVPGNYHPPNFTLLDQYGRRVTLHGLRGKVLLITYLDPVCTTDCPIIAQEFKQADRLLGHEARDVDLVAINANPIYRSPSVLQAFDRDEELGQLPNWIYLTGSLAQLRQVWNTFGVEAQVMPAGAMIAHTEGAAILDATGRLRWESGADPGAATASTKSSFAVTLADAARSVLHKA